MRPPKIKSTFHDTFLAGHGTFNLSMDIQIYTMVVMWDYKNKYKEKLVLLQSMGIIVIKGNETRVITYPNSS